MNISSSTDPVPSPSAASTISISSTRECDPISSSGTLYSSGPSYHFDVCRVVARARRFARKEVGASSHDIDITDPCESTHTGDISVIADTLTQDSSDAATSSSNCELHTKAWFLQRHLAPPESIEAFYKVLVLFRLIAFHDLRFAELYRRMTGVQYKMASLYKKMTDYNRCILRVKEGLEVRYPGGSTQLYTQGLAALEIEEATLNDEERDLIAFESDLYREEYACYLACHETPDKEELIAKNQRARKFGELERKAAYVDRAHACHCRLINKDRYNLSANELRLHEKKLRVELIHKQVSEKERRARNHFIVLYANKFRRYMENTFQKPNKRR